MDGHANFNPGFPVIIYEEGMALPDDGTYFLVSGNGLWLHKDTGIVKGFIPVKNISVLQELDAHAWVQCKLPKLPPRYVWRIKKFFAKVVAKHHSEATVTLYYNKEKNQYKLHIPKQRVSHGGVQYDRVAMTHLEDMEGYLRIGTIHSHCDFGASHSGTDIGDEEDFDGLHCTFGHNDRDQFTISASIVVNGYRLKIDPFDILEGVQALGEQEEKPGFLGFRKRAKESLYELIPVAPETEARWEEGIDQWLSKVQAGIGTLTPWAQLKKIRKGDMVEWAGELKTVSFRKTCGDGPFEVDTVEDGHVTVVTTVGLARFSDKLFKKVQSEDKKDQGNRSRRYRQPSD